MAVTAFQTLHILTPKILQWDSNAQFCGIYLNNAQKGGLAESGEDSGWRCIAYSAKRKKLGNFEENYFSDGRANPLVFKPLEPYMIKIKDVGNYQFLDSDWAVKKAIEIGLPVDVNNNVIAVVSSGIDQATKKMCWYFDYIKEVLFPGERWTLILDMVDGKIIQNKSSTDTT